MKMGFANALDVGLLITSITDTMPKYDYECPGEEIVMEFDLAFDHDAPRCSTCGADMRRVYSATSAIFKGSGWGSKP